MKRRYKFGMGLGVIAAAIYLNNASWIAGPPEREMTLLSHRGVHQTYHRMNLANDTCTAERIDLPTHGYLENMIDSFAAAIAAGAQMIELDIHPTTDGHFVVFHDWTMDCRTNGTGKTRDHSLADLKALDIGFGYTADGGKTYPFRGQFVGVMPTLAEVLQALPDTHFMINFKSRSKTEAASLISYLDSGEWKRLSVSGHIAPVHIVTESHPDVKGMTRQDSKACLKSYVLMGWTGHMPKACHNTFVPVPSNYRRLAWGWPHKFEQRLNKVGSRSILMGAYGGVGSTGIDSPEALRLVPKHYKGIVWTNKVEIVGPLLKPDVQSSE